MDAWAFESRKRAVLKECDVAPQVFRDVEPRLERFLEPFVASLVRREQVAHGGDWTRNGKDIEPRHRNAGEAKPCDMDAQAIEVR